MTLANFNSNFNWQYRMLKEAADCCGIVPDLPPAPPPPIVDCYWYATVHDPNCIGFGTFAFDWTLNGEPVWTGLWPSLMQNPPYGSAGSALQYTDNLSGCGAYAYSDYYFWTVVPSTVLTLPDLTGNDSNGNPVTVKMLGPVCATKCYEGSFRSTLGSIFAIGFNTAEVNATDFSIVVDLTDPGASASFTTQLGQFYPSPPLNVIVTVLAPDEYNIRIDGLYSTGTVVYVFMDDGVTIGELYAITC